MPASGAVRDAAEHYTGPLLPASDAPGVIRLRDEIDGWMRHAVMTGGDREALWAWVQSPAGNDDLNGVEARALGAGLPRSAAQPGRRPAREAARVRRVSAAPSEDLRAAVAAQGWFHTIDLGGGLVTDGRDESPRKLGWIGLPSDLRGRSVLDVGAWDGFFSFECERRGADRVVALDGPASNAPLSGATAEP